MLEMKNMSDWKIPHIIEMSIVIFTFFLPIVILVLIVFLLGAIYQEFIQIISPTQSGSLEILMAYIAVVGALSYFELRLIKWLRS